jgi:hypothetical protein
LKKETFRNPFTAQQIIYDPIRIELSRARRELTIASREAEFHKLAHSP